MSINLIDLIKGQLGPTMVSQVAAQLGESESGVSKAISALLPVVVGSMANSNSKADIFTSVKEAASSGILSNLLGSMGENNPFISKILSLIFGGDNKISSVINSVSNFAGISNNSTSSLLNLVTGATVGSLGKYVTDNNQDSHSFWSLLGNQKSYLSSLLPAGFSLASLGLGNWFDVDSTVKTVSPEINVKRNTSTSEVSSKSDSGGGFLKWLLPLLLLLLLGWFLWKQCSKKPEVTPITTVDSTMVNSDASNSNTSGTGSDTLTLKRETMLVTLPSGKTLQAYKGGIEDQIVTFLKSDDYKNATEDQLKDKWFNFDNLNFEFGKAVLTPDSKVQLENLKMILAEFPDAKIKIGAYTDKKGDANTNLKLSKERANTVKSSLNSAQVLEAEGYGSKFAKVPAEASDKERESDRKTSIRFIK